MEKIQQLLDEHKYKFLSGYYDLQVDESARNTFKTIEIKKYNDGELFGTMSLSDLLFNTPFLSWLEWNGRRGGTNWIHNYAYEEYDTITEEDSDYHKINLVLLSTDEERIEYVEEHVITDIGKWEQDAKELEDEINSKIKEGKWKVESI